MRLHSFVASPPSFAQGILAFVQNVACIYVYTHYLVVCFWVAGTDDVHHKVGQLSAVMFSAGLQQERDGAATYATVACRVYRG